MAGDWIKIEHVTPDKPEVHRMAEILKIDPDAVFGKLVRLWVWADQQTYFGNAVSVTLALLDRLSFVTGFANAMQEVGWLKSENGVIVFTNFDRHNGDTAKTRALTHKRVKRKRNADSVTKTLPEKSKSKRRKTPLPPEGEAGKPNPPDGEYTTDGSNPPPANRASQTFEIFWELFTNKTNREGALKAWREMVNETSLPESLFRKIIGKLKLWSKYWPTRPEDKRPFAATWIENKRWDDPDPPKVSEQQATGYKTAEETQRELNGY